MLEGFGTAVLQHKAAEQRDPALLHRQGIGVNGDELELEHGAKSMRGQGG
jgi:hypothetical protein